MGLNGAGAAWSRDWTSCGLLSSLLVYGSMNTSLLFSSRKGKTWVDCTSPSPVPPVSQREMLTGKAGDMITPGWYLRDTAVPPWRLTASLSAKEHANPSQQARFDGPPGNNDKTFQVLPIPTIFSLYPPPPPPLFFSLGLHKAPLSTWKQVVLQQSCSLSPLLAAAPKKVLKRPCRDQKWPGGHRHPVWRRVDFARRKHCIFTFSLFCLDRGQEMLTRLPRSHPHFCPSGAGLLQFPRPSISP